MFRLGTLYEELSKMGRCRGRERQTVSWKLKESLCFSEESETMMKTLR